MVKRNQNILSLKEQSKVAVAVGKAAIKCAAQVERPCVLMARVAARPMKNGALDVVKGIAEFVTFLVMLAMLLSKTGFDDAELNLLSWALCIVMACCLAAMVGVIIFREKFQDADKPAKGTGEAKTDTTTTFTNPMADEQEAEAEVAKKKTGFAKFAGAEKKEPPVACPLQQREETLRYPLTIVQ